MVGPERESGMSSGCTSQSVTAQSQHSHSTVTAQSQSQYSHSTVTAQSHHRWERVPEIGHNIAQCRTDEHGNEVEKGGM